MINLILMGNLSAFLQKTEFSQNYIYLIHSNNYVISHNTLLKKIKGNT